MTGTERTLPADERYFAFVRCYGDSIPGQTPCGIVGLTREQYSFQMRRPNRGWDCPNCGSTASYQDRLSEEAQEQEYEAEQLRYGRLPPP